MKLIQTKDYLLLIDEEAEINKGDYKHHHVTGLRKALVDGKYTNQNKVIAYYPLTKEAKELDLPLLPPFEEVDIKKLARYHYGHNRKTVEYEEGFLLGFDLGYKAAQQSNKQFSLEDMVNLLHFTIDKKGGLSSQEFREASYEEIVNKFTQSLSTQQLPKEFVTEIRKIDKYSYKDNYGKQRFTFKGLLKGDIIVSNKNQEGIGGDFIPFPMTLIKESKEYIIEKVSSFGFYTVPWIIDEDGNHTIPDFDLFSVKSKENFKTITNSEGKQELVGKYVY